MMNPIDPVTEIRNVREAHAAEHDFDLDRIVEEIRKGEDALAAKGWQVVTREKRFIIKLKIIRK